MLPSFMPPTCSLLLQAAQRMARRALCAASAALALLAVPAHASGLTGDPSLVPEAATLKLFNREIAVLRGSIAGLDPDERVDRAQARFAALTDAERQGAVTVAPVSVGGLQALSLRVAERPIVTLLPDDLDPEDHLSLSAAAERAQRRLQDALRAEREQAIPEVVLRGGATALGAAIALVVGFWGVLLVHSRLTAKAADSAQTHSVGFQAYLRLFAFRLLSGAVWLVLAGVVYMASVAVLGAFPWTQPWAEGLSGFVRSLGGWMLAGVTGAVPGLFTIGVVMLVARAIQEALSLFLGHVQSGRIRVPFMHAETVGATRRLLNILLWGLALAVAYPYLPGAQSEAFKGISVLFGLMITLGSTGLVSQLMSGLVVVYSRSMRRGDFVSVNGIEGVVSEVGALAVKMINMRNEEITLPHGVISASPIHNYSKLAGHQGTLVSTKVTIGYDTPWRQVHALLTRAASVTPGVRQQPEPFVYQRGLSDFYVEYELFAHVDKPLERVPILSALHAAIQDEFNQHGVQIMSPHFYEQPAQPVVVPRDQWHAAPARSPDA